MIHWEPINKKFGQQPMVVGVSGGVDSICLLQLLAQDPNTLKRLIVVHINYHLRGEDSNQDEKLVRNTCAQLNISIHVCDSPLTKKQKNLQAVARNIRYQYFSDIAKLHHTQLVVLAHHADDQNETILMRSLQGASWHGLAAMQPLKYYQMTAEPFFIWRPLLQLSKNYLRTLAISNQWNFREDSSNTTKLYLRNRIRNETLPTLIQHHPYLHMMLPRLSAFAKSYSEVIDQQVQAFFQKNQIIKNTFHVSVLQLLQLPRVLRWQCYEIIWKEKVGKALPFKKLQKLDQAVIDFRKGRILDFDRNWKWVIKQRQLLLKSI